MTGRGPERFEKLFCNIPRDSTTVHVLNHARQSAGGPMVSEKKIFISYSHADDALATALCGVFASMNAVTPFLSGDKRFGIPGGTVWFQEIVKALRNVDGLALLATPSSVKEAWPMFEAGALVAREKPALSILVGLKPEGLPGPLGQVQAVTADADDELLRYKLANALNADAKDVWTEAANAQLKVFQSLVATYKGPPATKKVLVTAEPKLSVWTGRSPLPPSTKVILVTVINHNDYAIRVTYVGLEFPKEPNAQTKALVPRDAELPRVVPPHDGSHFVFSEATLKDANAIGIGLTAHVALSTGDSLFSDGLVTLD